jgi:hypothetical protein
MKHQTVLILGGPKHGEFFAVPAGTQSIRRAVMADTVPAAYFREADESAPTEEIMTKNIDMPIKRRWIVGPDGNYCMQLVVEWYDY